MTTDRYLFSERKAPEQHIPSGLSTIPNLPRGAHYTSRKTSSLGSYPTLLVWATIFAWLCIGSLRAATFTPGDTLDGTNISTLRGAVIAANLLGGSNMIVLNESAYLLSIPGSAEDEAFTGDLDITNGTLTIIGTVATNVTINASALGDRVFQIHPGVQLVLSNVLVTGGKAANGQASGDAGESGGGIYNSGTLTLIRCAISGNSGGDGGAGVGYFSTCGAGGDGGGLFNAGSATLNDSLVASNSAGIAPNSDYYGGSGGSGGGIYNVGTIVLGNCTVVSNTCGAGGYGYLGVAGKAGRGGGICSIGALTLNDCIVSSNTSGAGGLNSFYSFGSSGGDGGGILSTNTLIMNRCILSNNSAGRGGGRGAQNGGTGGGIYVFGTATLNNCVLRSNVGGDGTVGFRNNEYDSGRGGDGGGAAGMFNGGTLELIDCTISGNTGGTGGNGGNLYMTMYGGDGGAGGAGGDGGGIRNFGTLTLSNCTIHGNSGGAGGAGERGIPLGAGGQGGSGGHCGGIDNFGSATLNNCTISDNSGGAGNEAGTTDGYLAGQFVFGRGGDGGGGGGIRNVGTVNLNASTITANRGGSGGRGGSGQTIANLGSGVHIIFRGGGAGGSGGGIQNLTNSASATLRNTLIALNQTGNGGLGGTNNFNQQIGPVGTNGVGPDLAGDFTSLSFNLVGQSDGSSGVTNGSSSDLAGSGATPLNPILAPLQDNGGATFTHALLAGSPALDHGKSFGLSVDQRGSLRIHDYYSIPSANGGDGSDIGAFESDLLYLAIAKHQTSAVLSWDANSPNSAVESTTNVALPSSWLPASGTLGLASGQYNFTNGPMIGIKFFRLKVN